MKTVNFCAVVIAASAFAIAVEYVYGWSDLEQLDTQRDVSSDHVVDAGLPGRR